MKTMKLNLNSRNIKPSTAGLLIALLFYIIGLSSVTAQKVTAEKINDRISFFIDGNLFTSYIFSENEKYPYFFPVNGPSKAGVTSMRNANYPHHSSLFFGCDKVNGGNYWQEEISRGQIISLRSEILEQDGNKAVMVNECIWTRPDADAPVKDKRIITVSAPSPDLFQIDFNIEMEMLQDVIIEKTNHSLFSARMDPDLAVINGGVMINAQGDRGESGTFGKPSGWIDYSGSRMGGIEGLAIMQHPSNRWYPAPWFTRDYGFISPTPIYWPGNNQSTELIKGEKVKLKYRVLVHSGNHIDARIADEYEIFKNQ